MSIDYYAIDSYLAERLEAVLGPRAAAAEEVAKVELAVALLRRGSLHRAWREKIQLCLTKHVKCFLGLRECCFLVT